LDQDNSIAHATYVSGPLNTHILARNADGSYLASMQKVPLEYRIERLSGEIETSLYGAFTALGEEPKLIHAYADVFASKIDFNTETRSGDRFELLVEKYYKADIFVSRRKMTRLRVIIMLLKIPRQAILMKTGKPWEPGLSGHQSLLAV
jgi:hypothetical protein